MRVTKTWSIAAAAAVLGALSIAGAQIGDAPEEAAQPPEAAAATQREVDLTPAQRVAAAEEFSQTMEQGANTVRRMLEDARAARDVVKVLCLNDKLNQINVAKRSANDRLDALRTAAERSDADRARHEFSILQVLKERGDTLVKEANQCIGEETGFIGESQISVQIDPNIPDTDPDELRFVPDILESPVLTSPVQ